MKKIFLLSLLITTTTFSQITDENGNAVVNSGNLTLTGNIGIGITPLSSSLYKLEVAGDMKANKGIFTNYQPDGSVFVDWMDKMEKSRMLGLGNKYTVAESSFNMWDIPQSNLDPTSSFALTAEDRNYKTRWYFRAHTGSYSELRYLNKNQSAFFKLHEDGNDNVFLELTKANSRIIIAGDNTYLPEHKFVVKDGSAMIEGNILTNAKIGIGLTSVEIPTDYQLAVAGKIISEEVKVKLQSSGWPDYVFNNDYNLPTLKEVEQHIKEKGHLKDIPSKEEVKEYGILLGDMNAKLLQKIEELTLYTIQQQKLIDMQSKAIEELSKAIKKIK